MVGLATLVMFGIVGLAVDVGRLYVTRVELGRSVDSAALSGILEFNGTAAGLTAAQTKAEWYFDQNEPGSNVTRVAWANPDANEMTVDATKTINMIFLSVLGIQTASVSAHAKAGFGTQYLDAVMVLDATPSMAGNPITQAKAAAISFKNILLGSNPLGNVKVGATAFRGCYKSPGPHTDCVSTSTWKTNLTASHTTLDTVLNAIQGGGGNVGTNVCTGLAMGWNIISGSGNHNDDILYPGNRQYMILLSDGDNYYPGNNTYTAPLGDDFSPANSASTPQGTVIGSTEYPCQPYNSCSSPWNTAPSNAPCVNGTAGATTTFVSDDFESGGWSGGSGWAAGSWTLTTGTPQVLSTGTPQGGSYHVRLDGPDDTITRVVDLSTITGADLYYYTKANNTLESGDNITLQISTNGSSWTTVETIGNHNGYTLRQESLDTYAGQATVYIRFNGVNLDDTNDVVYIDSIRIDSEDSDGFLNGNDGSSPTTCVGQTNTPRERQMDVRTLRLARAIKQQEVEVFVVAFSGGVPGCNLDNVTVYDDEDPADCNAVNDSTPGPIGNNTGEGTANHRLLKCIASNTQGSNDHYFYASDESELQGIFTQIANQIAHRLIE
jgi:Mg-chelatase subunit ChlD